VAKEPAQQLIAVLSRIVFALKTIVLVPMVMLRRVKLVPKTATIFVRLVPMGFTKTMTNVYNALHVVRASTELEQCAMAMETIHKRVLLVQTEIRRTLAYRANTKQE